MNKLTVGNLYDILSEILSKTPEAASVELYAAAEEPIDGGFRTNWDTCAPVSNMFWCRGTDGFIGKPVIHYVKEHIK